MENRYKPWTVEDERRAIRMRRACVNPIMIAATLGRPVLGVRIKLSRTGVEFPPLRRRPLKYDKKVVDRWREMQRAGSSRKQISEAEGVHTVIISRKFAQDIRGELV